MKTILKTAAAMFAFAAMTTAANAEDFALVQTNHAVAHSVVLQNIYAAMEENRAQTFELVMANAQARMEQRLAAIELNVAPMPSFNVAIE